MTGKLPYITSVNLFVLPIVGCWLGLGLLVDPMYLRS